MTLDDRIGAYACRRIDGFLRGHEGATARRIVFQAVISAHHAIAFETALRKRHQTMPAGIFQRRHPSIALPVHDDVLAADRPRKKRLLDIDIPCGGVPGVNREGLGHDSPLEFVWIPIVYILSCTNAIAGAKSALGGIYVYMNGKYSHESSSSAKAD